MFWQELTSDAFPAAVQAAGGVCLLPLGVMERHAHHLPLGTDMLIAHELCRRAAEIEPVIVFPDFYFTKIAEARCFPGAVSVEAELTYRLLENTCQEIARNGLKKIVIVSGHGGNHFLTRYLAQTQLASRRDYAVYVVDPAVPPQEEAELNALFTQGFSDHAGEGETSQVLAFRPDLVHMEQVPQEPEGAARGRLKDLSQANIFTAIWWYADYPTHYAGDARPAAAEKGERLLQSMARNLAANLRTVKQDDTTARLQAEFYDAAEHPVKGDALTGLGED